MWEVRNRSGRLYFSRGITPTYVGSTNLRFIYPIACKDHPHVCGKYTLSLISWVLPLGSPPRMWEVHIDLSACFFSHGITPTYVGSTVLETRKCKYEEGSPPRMWEVPANIISIVSLSRITPTYVGSTRISGTGTVEIKDHPHVCGKYLPAVK